MQEKDMVLDILSGIKASMGNYSKIIGECNNPTLRQTFQQMRDGDEKFQYDLYKLAEQKGYYHKAPPANQQDSSAIKNVLQSGMQNIQGIH